MLKRLLNFESKSVAAAALTVGVSFFASKFLGLLRDHILAYQFGAGDILDAYYAAFRIPDLIYNLLVLGALSAGFVPVFIGFLADKKKGDGGQEEAWRLANGVLNILTLALCFLAVLFVFLAPFITSSIVPGFQLEKIKTVVRLSQLMIFSPILLGISGIFSGILQSFKRFFAYSLAPIFYNLGIIFGALFLVKPFGIYGLAMGVLLGSLLHFLIQAPSLWNLGYRYKFFLDFLNPAVRQIGKMAIPRILGLAASQLNFLAITFFASILPAGSLAIFNFANNLQSFPIGVIGISFSTAVFPILSFYASSKDFSRFVQSLSAGLRQILLFIIPASILFLLLRAQIVRAVLGSGFFDWEDTILTADALAFFVLSLFGQAAIPLFARAFYALGDSLTPFWIGLISVGANIAASIYLIKILGVVGLAAAFSLSSILNILLLYLILRLRLGSLGEAATIPAVFKMSVAGLFMAVLIQAIKPLLASVVNMQTFLGVFLQGFIAGALGLALYFILCLIFKSKEAMEMKESLKRRVFFKEVVKTDIDGSNI